MLGARPDQEIAALIGRSPATVKQQRCQRGIPLQHPAHKFWTKKEEKLLGTRRDEEVARLLQRSVSSVKSHRLALGIAALWRNSAGFR